MVQIVENRKYPKYQRYLVIVSDRDFERTKYCDTWMQVKRYKNIARKIYGGPLLIIVYGINEFVISCHTIDKYGMSYYSREDKKEKKEIKKWWFG